ncbi:Carboxymuconolactone decarboxylase [Desulfovibrio sp. X2]|uniref:carboxymuconolactone decarboxylase family protein n=1 Tax=Desulfovibrio sp. X2 TaxID=941449 RepID=UPI000358A553|nr:carboxymuconolactone decarboxylase family protein [Desulfovibrio sp. X2]EPR44653.1 Carboxymuconolactone decarboxylase [Desulfovibrio sp. X2]
MEKKDKPPKHYRKIAERYPAFMDAVQALGKTVQEMGPLDAKTVRLIQLGAAAASLSTGSVQSHARRAREAGASREEIEHSVICLTSTLGFPNVAAALNWIDEALD